MSAYANSFFPMTAKIRGNIQAWPTQELFIGAVNGGPIPPPVYPVGTEWDTDMNAPSWDTAGGTFVKDTTP